MFYRWLSASRKARSKRLLLLEKEEQLKLSIAAKAWDKWRERYLDIRLRPMADTLLVQRQQYLVFRAFGIWHSKSTALPAVRFHASHLKAKFWRVWKEGMPRALQSKKAREMDQKTLLCMLILCISIKTVYLNHFYSESVGKVDRGVQNKAGTESCRVRTHTLPLPSPSLGLVAHDFVRRRARYLRLPTAAPRQVGPSFPRSMPPPKVPSISRANSPLPATGRIGATSRESNTTVEPQPVRRATTSVRPRLGIASLLAERPRSPERAGDRRSRPKRLLGPVSPGRPKLASRAGTVRGPSPAPSGTSVGAVSHYSEPASRFSAMPGREGGEIGRSQLWKELRGLQLRSRPLQTTDGSRSRGRLP